MKTLKATLSAFLSLSFLLRLRESHSPPTPLRVLISLPILAMRKCIRRIRKRLLKSIATYRIFLLKVKKLHNTMQKPENQFHLLTVLEHMETS